MIHRPSGRRLVAVFVAVAVTTGLVTFATAAPAQADDVSLAFVDSVTEMDRGDSVPDGITVAIDEATAAAHPDATMYLYPEEVDGERPPVELGVAGWECRPYLDGHSCAVKPRDGGTFTRWTFDVRANGDSVGQSGRFTARLAVGDDELAVVQHTITVLDDDMVELTGTKQTVTGTPGETAEFTPSFSNRQNVTVTGVVIEISGRDGGQPVAEYDNCFSSGSDFVTCVVPSAAIHSRSTLTVSAATPLRLRLDEQLPGPLTAACCGGDQIAYAISTADARQLLAENGGSETGNVLELVDSAPTGPPDTFSPGGNIFVTTTTDNFFDVEAGNTRLDGRNGDSVEVTVSATNHGPAGVIVRRDTPSQAMVVEPPTGVSFTETEHCRPLEGSGWFPDRDFREGSFICRVWHRVLPSGETYEFTLSATINGDAPATDGRVHYLMDWEELAALDSNPDNNTGMLTLNADA